MQGDLYQQPGFYRFNQDSLELVELVFEEERERSNLSLLDAMAGVGVIGIELGLRLKIKDLSFNEVQPIFSRYISQNAKALLPERSVTVFLCSFYNLPNISSKKFDVIVFNPPYFLKGNGRGSPCAEKDTCRRLSSADCYSIFESLKRLLKPKGRAYFCCPNKGWPEQELLACKKIHQRKDISFYCFVAEGRGK